MMMIFVSIAVAGLIVLVGGAIFGHDHDGDHGGLDHGHDHGSGAMVSIFSVKVIGMFIMGFGAAGAIARYYDLGPVPASLCGVGFGLVMGLLMYGILRALYSQQGNSLISTKELVGKTGVVMTTIAENSVGEVEVAYGDRRFTYLARCANGKEIQRGRAIKVTNINGSQLLVE